jgi:hypothetical protein
MKSLPLFLVRRIGFRVNPPTSPSESRSARYALYFILGGLMCQLLFFVPLYYFFEQNYNVFSELTFDVASPLIDHLTRERRWLRGFLVSALIGQALFFLVFGTRIFHRVFAPVDVLKRKINSLAKGYWRPWPLKLRRHDEFGEVVENLNYLSATLHAHAKTEMHILQRLRDKVDDPEYIFLIDQMLQIKANQTGLPLPAQPSVPVDSVRDSDLAS